jgi:steroid 5-alpha reductase family enzyme
MSLWQFTLLCWALSAVAMVAVWAFSVRVRNLGYVDVAWAGLLALCALLAGVLAPGGEQPRALVAVFGGAWGARLCLHLLARVLHEAEDGRYQALRARWGDAGWRHVAFFQLQALVVAVFAVPMFAAASRPGMPPAPVLAAAALVWAVAVVGETIADRQLARFRADPANRGRTCRVGLWAWSRHPNYFFEWLHWFAYAILAFDGPLFAWSLLGPVLMLAFLYRVSGIPWTEAQALRSRGEDYRRYQAEVSPFLPLPPRRGA